MAGLGNRRGSKTSSGSGSARDRISAAREKMNGSSRGSSKGISGGAKSRPKIGGGSKGSYILTESADNLIGGKFTKKSGPRRSTREELLEARKKRQEQKSGAGPRRVTREELLEKRKGVERQKDKTKIGAKRVTPEEIKALREKRLEQAKSKTGQRMRPGEGREDAKSKRPVRIGIGGKGGPKAGGNQIDKVRGPKKGGVIGGSGRDLTKARPGGNQIDKVRGPKSVGPKRAVPPEDRARIGGNQINNRGPKAGVGQGGKRGGQGPKRSPGQTGGNVGPGGKGPNRFGDFDYGVIV